MLQRVSGWVQTGGLWTRSMQTTMTAVRLCRCESTAPVCPILSLFIALPGGPFSTCKYKTRYTLPTMTLPGEPPARSYVERCNCCVLPGPALHQHRLGGPEPNSDACMPLPQQKEPRRRRPAAQRTRLATFDPRLRRLIGHRSPCKFHVVVKNRSWTLSPRRSGHSTADFPRLLMFARDTGLSIFAFPIAHRAVSHAVVYARGKPATCRNRYWTGQRRGLVRFSK